VAIIYSVEKLDVNTQETVRRAIIATMFLCGFFNQPNLKEIFEEIP
jgi:hypothetical protein